MAHSRRSFPTHLRRQVWRRLYSSTRLDPPTSSLEAKESIPIVPSCPPPTCPCAATPTGLDIDRQKTMIAPQYTRHVVIWTGRQDWASRIEDEESSFFGIKHLGRPRANLAKSLKELVGLGGKYYNVSGFFLNI